MIYLNKILPVLVMPIMLLIYLLIFGLWKKKRWPIYTAMVCLYLFSTPIYADIELFKAGKAPKIIFTRGKMPWDKSKNTEGDILKKFALDYGIPDAAIILSGDVENTADEAKAVGKLIGKGKHIILVTSAYHMPRSVQLFQNQELIVKPYKVDYKVDPFSSVTIMDLLPDGDSFRLLNTGYRELIGRVIYYLF